MSKRLSRRASLGILISALLYFALLLSACLALRPMRTKLHPRQPRQQPRRGK